MKGKEILPRPEHPRPDFFRRDWINLNGSWQFKIDRANEGLQKEFFRSETPFPERIVVPFCPESSLSGIGTKDFLVCVWYRRNFTLPEKWKNKRILLHFGAVDYETDVWLNENYLGRHIGGYTPFSFEITHLVKRGENTITVRAYDDNRTGKQPSGKQSPRYESYAGQYTRVTGIWQTVWLEAVGPAYLKCFRFSPDSANEKLTLQLQTEGATRAKVQVFCEDQPVGEKTIQADGLVKLEIPIRRPILWSPTYPHLYRVTITLFSGQEIYDQVGSYCGFRTIQIKGNQFLLNGHPLFLRLILDQGYYPDGIYTARTEEDLKKDILLATNLGFQGARLHQKVFEPRFLYWADKLGYLVWGEYGSWAADAKVYPGTPAEWIEAVLRDINHPSIIGWCPLNETSPRQPLETTRNLYWLTKIVDPDRPVIDTSGYIHVETDLYDCHNYTQDPKEFARMFAPLRKDPSAIWRKYPQYDAPYRGQPYWVSEYGGTWWNQKGEKTGWGYGQTPRSKKEFLERYRGLTETLLFHPRICGFAYTQLYDVEQEQNGLYTYQREEKFPAETIRAINTQPAAMERG
ncbi:MAG: beta galactosidase jelly roll domain-containing protein [Candidatus Omnitrophica bacterium]|nr:beta galactosidase jelly roll domain-containing protein [Candidatus Omnitrophota bacterium]